MDEQNQQQQPFQIPTSQEDLQQFIALVVNVVAQLDDHTLSQLRESQQSVDEVAQALTRQMHQATQPFIPPQPEWTIEATTIEDLMHEDDLEHDIEVGVIFSSSYTRVNRNGEQVLYLSSEYYDESVLEAAKEDDLQPRPSGRASVSTAIRLGDQHLALVHGGSDITPKTLETIEGSIERQKDPDQLTPSLTASSEPRISWPTYMKGVSNARQ